ncbi:ornithine carbamoyltransferase [Alphaproteobacteria bacterium]|nr:ornithine carbamoyltransferase [Alphaproteobacteria bacterium]
MPNFIDLKELTTEDLIQIISLSIKWKSIGAPKFMKDKQAVLIFEKPSLRTRISFEVGINQLGGNSTILNEKEMQLGQRETIEDTARVLERYADMIVIRCFGHNQMINFANTSNVPVINALTDYSHPCQVVADLVTIKEHLIDFKNKKIAWFGDCNNVLQSWIEASVLLDFELNIACPEGVVPHQETMTWAIKKNNKIKIMHDPYLAADGANCIITDTWTSMGDENISPEKIFLPFQVNENIMSLADKNAIFMHCLPAYRGKEVSKDVFEGMQSVVFDEAENRLHAQKAIMHYCLS